MANKNEPLVIIVRTQKEANSPSIELTDADAPSADPEKTGEGARALRGSRFGFIFGIAAQAESLLADEMSYSMSKYASLTDDYEYGIAVQNARANLNVVGSIAGSTISTATIGAKAFGVAGAAVGAAVGVALGGVTVAVKAQQDLASQQTALNQQAYSLYYSTERAGLVNGSRYTEN